MQWFKDITIENVPQVGGKTASLGEMFRELQPKGVNIPNGFAVTAQAYFYFTKEAGIQESIREALDGLDISNTRDLEERGSKVRRLILKHNFPADLEEEIASSYTKLCAEFNMDEVDVAVRSSATAEDLPNASFAGQQETFLNVRGRADLLIACRKCMASLFTNRAIAYRVNNGFDHFQVGLSICVQKMVRSDMAASGVMFSIDTESGHKNMVFITASWGLGENIVQGNVNPDEFYVFKPLLGKPGLKPIVQRSLGSKQFRMVYASDSSKAVKNIRTGKQDRVRFCCTDEEVLTLAKWGVQIEEHYSAKRNKFVPMDMEWAKDGQTGKLFIVQARPETVHSQDDKTKFKTFKLQPNDAKVLARGQSVGSKIGVGKTHIITDVHNIHEFEAGEVLVTEMTDPDWAPIMKKAAAIVTNRGGRTCHAAIISRELGIPCVVGCGTATATVPSDVVVTVDCSAGEHGQVLQGDVPYKIEEHDLSEVPETKTKVMMILGNPDLAFDLSFLPAKGVGLVRMEFMVMNHIKVHPLALLHPEKLDEEETVTVQELTAGYASGEEYFVSRLADGIATIAAAFHPHDVILRFSDFKTNEYANLLCGHHFEPTEDNPMIGWRGASRYYDPKYADGFALECKAVSKVRDEMGLTNLITMIPFCRTVDEARRVLATMEKNGLKQGDNGLKVYAMCEIPSNVILAEEFLDVLDGFSIGSNDLTQLVLGIDRDSELVSHLYDERNPAVKTMIKQVVEVARRKGKYIGICGQGPSDHADFCDFLVDIGIHSISLNPDTVLSTISRIAEREKSKQ